MHSSNTSHENHNKISENSPNVAVRILEDNVSPASRPAADHSTTRQSYSDYATTLLFVCLLVVLCPLIYSCVLVIVLAVFPLLVVSLLLTRIFQFFRYRNHYRRLTYFKHFLRGWIYIDVVLIIIGLMIFWIIAKCVPSLKLILLLDLPLTSWAFNIGLMCVFYVLSFVVYKFIHELTLHLPFQSVKVAQASSEICDALIFWWAEHVLLRRVPTFMHHQILELPTRKWIRVSILILIAYNLITLFLQLFVLTLRHICLQQLQNQVFNKPILQHLILKFVQKKYVVYFANGMKFSISFIMSSLLILLTWILYFGSRLEMKSPKVKLIWDFGYWTFLSIVILSLFWLIKTFVLLAWESHTVYRRLDDRIISISEQLYILGILGYHKYDILKIRPRGKSGHQTHSDDGISQNSSVFYLYISTIFSKLKLLSGFERNRTTNHGHKKRKRANNDLLIQNQNDPTIDDLQRASLFFLEAKKLLSQENYISQILKMLKKLENDVLLEDNHGRETQENFQYNEDPEEQMNLVTDFRNFVTKHNIRVGSNSNTSDSSKISMQTWVERAHNQCMFLANTLGSAEQVSGCLNKIISWVLIGVTFLLWLLLTGLATTQVLVLVASPLLAATFIFGNSFKILFEGILFVYLVHPLDVGDLCTIEDDTLMEVTAISIWTTTFKKVDKTGTTEVVIYPNSELANKVLINHKTKFDWSDCLQFCLGSVIKINFNNENNIDQVFKFEAEDLKLLSSDPILTVSVVEDIIKLVIRVKYEVKHTKAWTYSECLRQKDKKRAEFVLRVLRLINENCQG